MECMFTDNYKGLFTWTRDSELPRGKRYLAFTWWFVVSGQRCPGSTSLPRGKFIVIWSLRIYPNSFSFYTNCYREWILNSFTYFWCFLELFIGKFIRNIKIEHAQDCSCPEATFAFCSHGKKLPRQGGLPGVGQRVTRLSKLPRGNEKLMWTFTGVRPSTEAKLTPGSVSYPGAMSCPGIMWTGPNSSFCFWVFEKRLTQKNCFLFCKKYGLFNSFIFLTIKKFLLSYFLNFHGQRSGGGGQDLNISYQKQSCFSHGEGLFK